MLESAGVKEKEKAREARPEGWGKCAVLNRIRKTSGEGISSVSHQGRGKYRALRPEDARHSRQPAGTQSGRTDSESLVRTSAFTLPSGPHPREEFCPKKFRVTVYLCGLTTNYIACRRAGSAPCNLHKARLSLSYSIRGPGPGSPLSSSGHTFVLTGFFPDSSQHFFKCLECWPPLLRQALNVSSFHWHCLYSGYLQGENITKPKAESVKLGITT